DATEPPPSSSPGRVIGYFPSWAVYGRDFHVSDIPAEHLSHILYAFANVSTAGECILGDPYADIDKFYEGDSWDEGALRGSFNQLLLLKESHPHLKTQLSVGGWTWSGNFSSAASTAAGREAFASSCVALARIYGFDGLDIDWEYPVEGGLPSNGTSPDDRENYTLLLQEIRNQLNAAEITDGKDYLLTIASTASPNYIPNLEPAQLALVLDWINVMTYDFHGAWEQQTGLHAPLYSVPGDPSTLAAELTVDAAITTFLAAGVPAEQLVVGVPFYGRGWSGVAATNDGLFQPAPTVPMGTWEAGVFDYVDLMNNYVTPATRFWEPGGQVPWFFDPATGVMISYEDTESAAIKANYVLDNNLGGVMFWELSADTADAELLSSITGVLGLPSTAGP
ncbi:MAG: glycoside hydrolase family 18 protein, partial [Myxococcota bacterium]|nr:glycoside hydrolase family 18 protein [Myxococcota bacterium]